MDHIVVFLEGYLSYIMNIISMIAAWCLSNQKVIIGRYLGACSASLFILYGVITNQPAFIIADIIFLYIYISAVMKFNKKRDSYKLKAATDEETIAQMRQVIKRANEIEHKILETRIGEQTPKKT